MSVLDLIAILLLGPAALTALLGALAGKHGLRMALGLAATGTVAWIVWTATSWDPDAHRVAVLEPILLGFASGLTWLGVTLGWAGLGVGRDLRARLSARR